MVTLFRVRWALTAMAAVALTSAPASAATPAQNCQSAKNKEAGKYEGCRQKAEAKFATSLDGVKLAADQSTCLTKYQAKWPALEAKAIAQGGACPSVGDQAAIQGAIDQHTTNIATAVGGGVLQDCPADLLSCQGDLGTCNGGLTACTGSLGTCTGSLGTCNTALGTTQASLTACTGDLGTCNSTLASTQSTLAATQTSLSTCTTNLATTQSGLTTCTTNLGTTQASLTACTTALGTCPGDLTTCQGNLATCQAAAQGQRLTTGHTLCYDVSGTVIGCAGTGQDGELQKGLVRSYTDNGNGTITDNRTGLVWEKLSDDGSIHDKDATYTYTTAVTTKVATLNSGSFAGFTDWRVPNLEELESLRNLGTANPAVFSAFNTNCVAACTVLTCSCTRSNAYWSSSAYLNAPSNAWDVTFFDGFVNVNGKPNTKSVRAVRGGS
jgi:Protein of unknown function (DUF1566)